MKIFHLVCHYFCNKVKFRNFAQRENDNLMKPFSFISKRHVIKGYKKSAKK